MTVSPASTTVDDRVRVGHRALEDLQILAKRLMPINSPHSRINGLKLGGEHRERCVDVVAVEILIEPSNELSLAVAAHPRTPQIDYQYRRDPTPSQTTPTRDISLPSLARSPK